MSSTDHGNTDIHPKIHTFPIQLQQKVCRPTKYISNASSLMNDQFTRPSLIIIPCEDEDGRHQEILQQVYDYPKGSITTVVERTSHIKIEKDERENTNLYIPVQKKGQSVHGSSNSLSSAVSANSSLSNKSLHWNNDSVIEPHFPITTIPSCLQPSQVKSLSFDVASDISSNFSNASDMTGYEDEYSAIKRVVSDTPGIHRERVLELHPTTNKLAHSNDKLLEFESLAKSLQNCKEDLEIKVNRLEIQLQNNVREKECHKEKVDNLQTKIIEMEQIDHFEILKQKSNLESQYKVLKHEYENIMKDKCVMSSQISDLKKTLATKHDSFDCLSKSNYYLQEELARLTEKNVEGDCMISNLKNCLDSETNQFQKFESSFEESQIIITKHETKIDQQVNEINSLQHSMVTLHKIIAKNKLYEENMLENLVNVKNQFEDLNVKYSSLTNDHKWSHNQLEKCQKQLLHMQNELEHCKNSLVLETAESIRLKKKNETLSCTLEDNRASAMREKSTLLFHFEELEGDMKEREIALRLQMTENSHHVKLPSERLNKLEQEHNRLQTLQIEYSDMQRKNDSLIEELRYKSLSLENIEISMQKRNKDLEKAQKDLGERDVQINSLNDQLNNMRIKLKLSLEKQCHQNVVITELRKQSLQLETALKNATDEKIQVDETISKLRDDANKLSTNYYRMKHDISAKDRQVDILTQSNSDLIQNELVLQSQYKNLIIESKSCKVSTDLEKEIKDLLCIETSLKSTVLELEEQHSSFKKSLNLCNIEKETLSKELNIRDELILNLQATLVEYKENLLLKDEEIYACNSHNNKVEKSHSDLQTKFVDVCGDLSKLQHEREEFIEVEANLPRIVQDLNESLKLEKGTKDLNERKLDLMKLSHERELASLSRNHLEFENSGQENLHSLESLKTRDLFNNVIHQRELQCTSGNKNEAQKVRDQPLLSETNNEMKVNEKQPKMLKNGAQDDGNINGNELYLEGLNSSETTTSKMLKSQLEIKIDELKSLQETFNAAEFDHESKLKVLSEEMYLKLNHVENRLRNFENCLSLKEEECREWKSRYESLIDLIPQKDTNTQVAVQFPSYCDDLNSETIYPSFILCRDRLSSRTNDPFLSEMSSRSHNDNIEYDENDASLHLPFHGETLEKERSTTVSKDVGIVAEQTIIITPRDNIKPSFTNGSTLENRCPVEADFIDKEMTKGKEFEKDGSSDIIILKEKTSRINELEMMLRESGREFDVKQKRYESNVRLLTKKLKEHLKGRRLSEKHLEHLTEESKQTIAREQNKYLELMERFRESEKKTQDLEFCDKILNEDLEKKQKCLEEAEDRTTCLQATNNLDLENRAGQIQELENYLETSRSEISSLETLTQSQNIAEEETRNEFRKCESERLSLQDECKILFAEKEKWDNLLKNLYKEVEDSKALLESQKKDLISKDEEIVSLEKDFAKSSSRNEEFEKRLVELKENSSRDKKFLTEKINFLQVDFDAKEDLRKELLSKVQVLENQIQLNEDTLEASNIERQRLQQQLKESDTNHLSSVAIFNAKIDKTKELEEELNGKLKCVLKQKLLLQTEVMEFKESLHSALQHINKLESVDLPSPAALDIESISKLMDKCSQTFYNNENLDSLTEKFASLRDEVYNLKREVGN